MTTQAKSGKAVCWLPASSAGVLCTPRLTKQRNRHRADQPLDTYSSVRVDEEPSDFRTVAEECPCAHYMQYLSIQFRKALT